MDRLNLPVAVCAILFMGCAQKPTKPKAEDPEKYLTPEEKRAYEFLKITGGNLTDADLERPDLKHLKNLTIHGTKVTGQGLRFLKDLKYLTLISEEITNEGLQSIKTLENLEALRISGKKVTDEDLKGFTELKRLEYLNLMDTQVAGPGLAELAHLPGLKNLVLSRTPVKTIKHLAPCPALETLELADTQIDDQGLENVK